MLYSEIARHYIPAPRINYMRVVINGESWGIYVNAQQFNKDFLRDNFTTEKGARWKVPGSPAAAAAWNTSVTMSSAYKRIYEIKTKDDPKAWADLIRLFKVLNETPPEKLEAALAPILDVDARLKFLALDVALVNSDGYWTRASDYSIYQDEKGRFHVIPHDMNEGSPTRAAASAAVLLEAHPAACLLRPRMAVSPAEGAFQAAGSDAAPRPTRSWIPSSA